MEYSRKYEIQNKVKTPKEETNKKIIKKTKLGPSNMEKIVMLNL
jgi:hypothetical protein